MPIVSIANSKGGSGKTTLTTALAVNLACDGYRVAVIDADVNGTFSTWYRSATSPPMSVTACPDHNKIERIWQDLHANVTRNHRQPTMTKLMEEVRYYLRKRNRHKRRLIAA